MKRRFQVYSNNVKERENWALREFTYTMLSYRASNVRSEKRGINAHTLDSAPMSYIPLHPDPFA
jgi:hypothetical protein